MLIIYRTQISDEGVRYLMNGLQNNRVRRTFSTILSHILIIAIANISHRNVKLLPLSYIPANRMRN
jgi:hypothetical protein